MFIGETKIITIIVVVLFGWSGNPLVISLVGGLLRDHPNRWEYYLKKLRDKKYSRLRKASSYEYESVDEAMGVSVDQLPEESRELYFDFVVFDAGVKISAKVSAVFQFWFICG